MKPGEILDRYYQLRTKVDALWQRFCSYAGADSACALGCDGCCHVDLSVGPVEAHVLAEALCSTDARLQATLAHRMGQPDEDCLLLGSGQCALYQHRPIICRTHGLWVRLDPETDNGGPRLSICPLNAHIEPCDGLVLDLARLNPTLALLDHLWLQADPAQPSRVPVRHLVRRICHP